MTHLVGSLFSGIGGMDAGLHRAGFEHAFFAELDPWRREVLAERWPGVPIYEDVRLVANEQSSPRTHRPDAPGGEVSEPWWDGRATGLDLLCGGFPCQDLSVAGKRAGLAGSRSGLFFEFARIIDAFRPGWVLVENVPGLLSSNGGRDFGVVLGTLADLGYGVGWRILDSRFFGVPQRRRRVFIVGTVADGDPRAAAERAGEVLAVGSRCGRHSAARDEEGPGATPASSIGSLTAHKAGGWRIGADEAAAGQLVAAPLTKGSATGKGVNAPGRRQEDDVNIVAFHPTGGGAKGLSESEDIAPGTGTGRGGTVAIAGTLRQHTRPGSNNSTDIVEESGVRRLTPRECERLQGLPDDWTLLDDKTPDSRRYSGLGDAVTANVAEWIGRRLVAELVA